jgi:hypothetical protein
MTEQIKAQDIQPGMIVRTASDEKFPVTKVTVKWGAVQISDDIHWRGLGLNEPITLLGHFNP